MVLYKTQQRKILLDFLDANPHRRFSAREMAQQLEEKGISQSAVYRNLSTLVESGFVRRYANGKSREIFYQYTGAAQCHKILHISCLHCGTIEHSSSTVLERISKDMLAENGFTVDAEKSMFFGCCSRCREA